MSYDVITGCFFTSSAILKCHIIKRCLSHLTISSSSISGELEDVKTHPLPIVYIYLTGYKNDICNRKMVRKTTITPC